MSIEIKTQMTGNVWKIVVTEGQQVEEDQEVLILESMKMEIPVLSPEDGKIIELKVKEGEFVSEGDVIAILEEE